jgi:hypothetical protein
MREAIEDLPEDEREVSGQVRIQGLMQSEAADSVRRDLKPSDVLLSGIAPCYAGRNSPSGC